MEDLSLHILDVVENSIEARATEIEIVIREKIKDDLLTITIRDNGKGMTKNNIDKLLDPFFTTRTTRKVGLGLSLLAQAARQCCGNISISSEIGIGTEVSAYFKNSHIDRKPFGNIKQTLKVLIAAHPEINFIYDYKSE